MIEESKKEQTAYNKVGKWKMITGASLQRLINLKKIEAERKTSVTRPQVQKGNSFGSVFEKDYKFYSDVGIKDKTKDHKDKPRHLEDVSSLS